MVTFAETTTEEAEAIQTIINRAVDMSAQEGVTLDRIDLHMDLLAVHHTCPLRLVELAQARDTDFGHDVYGIMRYLNRNTGELTRSFLPRYSR